MNTPDTSEDRAQWGWLWVCLGLIALAILLFVTEGPPTTDHSQPSTPQIETPAS